MSRPQDGRGVSTRPPQAPAYSTNEGTLAGLTGPPLAGRVGATKERRVETPGRPRRPDTASAGSGPLDQRGHSRWSNRPTPRWSSRSDEGATCRDPVTVAGSRHGLRRLRPTRPTRALSLVEPAHPSLVEWERRRSDVSRPRDRRGVSACVVGGVHQVERIHHLGVPRAAIHSRRTYGGSRRCDRVCWTAWHGPTSSGAATTRCTSGAPTTSSAGSLSTASGSALATQRGGAR